MPFRKTNEAATSSTKYCPYCYLGLITDPAKLILLLNDSSDLQERHVGLAGTYSESYATYERLCEITADTTLLQLTYHSNPKIRVYAMWALSTKNKAMAMKELARLKKDHAKVSYFSGCIKSSWPVSLIISTHLNSANLKVKSLSKDCVEISMD